MVGLPAHSPPLRERQSSTGLAAREVPQSLDVGAAQRRSSDPNLDSPAILKQRLADISMEVTTKDVSQPFQSPQLSQKASPASTTVGPDIGNALASESGGQTANVAVWGRLHGRLQSRILQLEAKDDERSTEQKALAQSMADVERRLEIIETQSIEAIEMRLQERVERLCEEICERSLQGNHSASSLRNRKVQSSAGGTGGPLTDSAVPSECSASTTKESLPNELSLEAQLTSHGPTAELARIQVEVARQGAHLLDIDNRLEQQLKLLEAMAAESQRSVEGDEFGKEVFGMREQIRQLEQVVSASMDTGPAYQCEDAQERRSNATEAQLQERFEALESSLMSHFPFLKSIASTADIDGRSDTTASVSAGAPSRIGLKQSGSTPVLPSPAFVTKRQTSRGPRHKADDVWDKFVDDFVEESQVGSAPVADTHASLASTAVVSGSSGDACVLAANAIPAASTQERVLSRPPLPQQQGLSLNVKPGQTQGLGYSLSVSPGQPSQSFVAPPVRSPSPLTRVGSAPNSAPIAVTGYRPGTTVVGRPAPASQSPGFGSCRCPSGSSLCIPGSPVVPVAGCSLKHAPSQPALAGSISESVPRRAASPLVCTGASRWN